MKGIDALFPRFFLLTLATSDTVYRRWHSVASNDVPEYHEAAWGYEKKMLRR
jgi:hypothetical protein